MLDCLLEQEVSYRDLVVDSYSRWIENFCTCTSEENCECPTIKEWEDIMDQQQQNQYDFF